LGDAAAAALGRRHALGFAVLGAAFLAVTGMAANMPAARPKENEPVLTAAIAKR